MSEGFAKVPHHEICEGSIIEYKGNLLTACAIYDDCILFISVQAEKRLSFTKLSKAGLFNLFLLKSRILVKTNKAPQIMLREADVKTLLSGDALRDGRPIFDPGIYDVLEPCAIVEIPYNGPNTDDMPMPETVQGYVYRYDQGADGGEYDWISPARMPADAVRLRVKVTKIEGGYKLSPVK